MTNVYHKILQGRLIPVDENLSSKRYEPPFIDLTDKNSSYTLLIEFTGFDKNILEIGTSSGYISKILKEHRNSVTGVEIDTEAGMIAQKYCNRMIIEDVEKLDFEKTFEPASFDAVLCGDILEHLKNPSIFLEKIKPFLKPDGFLVVSLPNFCHGDVLINILQGDFHYTPTGLLDITHLRFFGLKNIYTLFAGTGYKITDIRTVNHDIGTTELMKDNQKIPEHLSDLIRALPNSTVYQFVFTARPSTFNETPVFPESDLKEIADYVEIIKTLELPCTGVSDTGADRTLLYRDQILCLLARVCELERQKKSAAEHLVRDVQNAIQKNQQENEARHRKLLHSLRQIQRENEGMKKSVTYQLTTRFHHRIIEPLFPDNSRRRKIYELGLRSGRIVISEGIGQLFSEYRKRRAYLARKTREDMAVTNSLPAQFPDVTADQSTATPSTFKDTSCKPQEYVPLLQNPVSLMPDDIRLIAFYLPQFHPIPENDRWWGKGFTEWTNVTKAVPQFEGHYQPHLPGELGFYDLRLPEIQKRQVELAKHYGLSGFCFYYYWFDGKKLLDLPLAQYLNHKEYDLPFCICWANENWTRRWDGQENEVLMAQSHTVESDINFIRDVEHILRDPRYIRISGKPVVIVYRFTLLPEPGETILRWRKYCRDCGIGEIYLMAALTFHCGDPTECGFDAAIEFPPHLMPGCPNITRDMLIINPEFSGIIYDYEKFIHERKYLLPTPFKVFKTVAPGWDNTPRRMDKGKIFAGSNPRLYKKWLLDVCQWTKLNHSPDEQYVFINAWNEWAEGAHLEPDRKFGYGNLQATSEVIRETRNISTRIPPENTQKDPE
jgi:2-polyprenyl-3-methyl-5-hydroxy-6-metoxy-1,4-benzoquinol methylase